jgi:ASC-1-like (ASCH) protein
MEHLAIMKKSWKLTEKILSGEKKIESRWYMSKYPPWDKIKSGETIYFKDSGDPVKIKTEVEKVFQFDNLNSKKVKEILNKYGGKDGIAIEDIPKFFDLFKNKKYCMLIFLKNPKKIDPFEINKKGFGLMASWICIKNINRIKLFSN